MKIKFFNSNKEDKTIENLLNIKNDDEIFSRLTVLQNEISVSFKNKVTAVVGVKNDKLAATFAKGYADAFARNESKTLIFLFHPNFKNKLKISKWIES